MYNSFQIWYIFLCHDKFGNTRDDVFILCRIMNNQQQLIGMPCCVETKLCFFISVQIVSQLCIHYWNYRSNCSILFYFFKCRDLLFVKGHFQGYLFTHLCSIIIYYKVISTPLHTGAAFLNHPIESDGIAMCRYKYKIHLEFFIHLVN